MSESIARRIQIWAALLVAVAGPATMQASADTFHVNGSCGNDAWSGSSSACSAPNGPKRTIQAGIDASANGDTVLVADGPYTGTSNKNLDYEARLITLRSENGPTACIIDCELDGRGFYFQNGETADAVLEGFTIRNGSEDLGGAIRCQNASPTILNCVLANNEAAREGGGMYNLSSSPTVTRCTFSGNSAGAGGGMSSLDANPIVTDCTFSGNNASWGGGMLNEFSSLTMTDCEFTDNAAVSHGGGMYNSSSSPRVANCTFSGNSADLRGGGMFNEGGLGGNPAVINCILWNNSPDEIGERFGVVTTVRFSDVQAGWPGEGNIDDDPLFVDPANADYRLATGSPCIDAADNAAVPAGITADLAGNPRFVDDPATPDTGVPGGAGGPAIVDMGAYEFPCDPCDMNCDGTVDAVDIEFFIDILFNAATPCGTCTGDTNGDGLIDARDIEGFINCLFP